jgi:hypothetical protein
MQMRQHLPFESVRRRTELWALQTPMAIRSPSEHFHPSSPDSATLPDLERCPQFEFDAIHQKECCLVSNSRMRIKSCAQTASRTRSQQLQSISLSLSTTTEKSGEHPPTNQSEHTRTQFSVPSNLKKQQNQKWQRRMDRPDSSVSQSHSEFQAEFQIHRLSQHRNGQIISQQFKNCQKVADTIHIDLDWQLQLIDIFQTLKDQEDTPTGRADPNRVVEFA